MAECERLRRDNGVGTPADFLDAEADLLQAKANLTLARNAMIFGSPQLGAGSFVAL